MSDLHNQDDDIDENPGFRRYGVSLKVEVKILLTETFCKIPRLFYQGSGAKATDGRRGEIKTRGGGFKKGIQTQYRFTYAAVGAGSPRPGL
jgi:hypothetical protein